MFIRSAIAQAVCLCTFIAHFSAISINAQAVPWPDDANVKNVKNEPYFAKGDGVTDDTEALREAIKDGIRWNNRYHRPTLVFIPKGTYRVTDSLWARLDPGSFSKGWLCGSHVLGEGKDLTIIKLDDNLAKFGNPEKPFALFKTGSEEKSHNRAFRHHFFDLTVDVGKGNQGAIGISYIVSNRGSINNVRVISSDPDYAGHTGIEIYAGSGPGMLNNVEVIGFDYGITSSWTILGTTMEDITVKHQRKIGIWNNKNAIYLRKFKSENAVTAFSSSDPLGHVVIVDSEIKGSGNNDEQTAGIFCAGNGLLSAIRISGYKIPVSTPDNNVMSDYIHELVTPVPSFSLFQPRGTTNLLRLPVEETPYYHPSDMKQWTNVLDHGATVSSKEDNDDGVGIQAAIDASNGVVYLPGGKYAIKKTVLIRGNVKRIVGCCAQINGQCNPVFKFVDGNAPFTIMEHIRMRDQGNIVHDSNRDLVLTHMDLMNYSNTSRGTGKLFVEDVIGNSFTINKPQKAWMRQFNSENPQCHVLNNGSAVWILGIKTEKYATVVKTVNGGASEVLGAMIYPATNKAGYPQEPAFIVQNSRFAASFAEAVFNGEQVLPVHVEEKSDGTTKKFLRNDGLNRGMGRVVPLYSNFEDKSIAIDWFPRAAAAPTQQSNNVMLFDMMGRSLRPSFSAGANRFAVPQNLAQGILLRAIADEKMKIRSVGKINSIR